METRKYVVEMIATFFLTLAVSISLTIGTPLATPVVAALTVGIFVYTIGPISGAHLNPAVTIALATVGKIKINEAFAYVVSQVVGAFLAMLILPTYIAESVNLLAFDTVPVGLAEAFGAFLLVFGICGVVYGKVDDDASGLVIGGSLLAGLMVAGGVSNGVLNPAVALGIGSISAVYLIAPILGGVIGAWTYKWVADK